MSYEKKEPPAANLSLSRIAWSMKELVDEIRKMNGNQDSGNSQEYQRGQGSEGSKESDDIPF